MWTLLIWIPLVALLHYQWLATFRRSQAWVDLYFRRSDRLFDLMSEYLYGDVPSERLLELIKADQELVQELLDIPLWKLWPRLER